MTLLNRIQDYWDTRSDDFNNTRLQELHSKNAAAWRNFIISFLPDKTPLKILDIGTGTGFFPLILNTPDYSITGIDGSKEMIANATANARKFNCHAEFLQMDAQNLTFADNSFNVVISRNLTWTLPNPVKAYQEWMRVLKPEGILLNFDADYGKMQFSRGDNTSSVHATINDNLLNECNMIKSSLTISKKSRPDWDISVLKELGLSNLTYQEDIRSFVHKDENLQYDDIAIFALYGQLN